MRHVPLTPAPLSDDKRLLRWCHDKIVELSRASHIDEISSYTLKKLADALAGKLTAAENLSDVANRAAAFNNIKQSASTTETGVVEKAEAAEVAAAQPDKFLAADHLQSASAPVSLEYDSIVDINWKGFINAELVVQGNCEISNPTDGIPGTWRTIIVKGNNSTQRTIAFGDQFGGEVPQISDVTDTKWYQIFLYCVSSTHFLASARDASPPSP